MAKTRLTMLSRSKIRDKLLARAFDHREKELLARRPELAKLAFDEIVTPEEQKIAAELGDDWLPTTQFVDVDDSTGNTYEEIGRYGVRFEMAYPERYPSHRQISIRPSGMSDDLLAAIEEHVAAEQAHVKARDEALLQTNAVLATYNWVEDLVTGWPEAASVIHEVVTASGAIRDLPVTTNLNKLLDLPPSGGEA